MLISARVRQRLWLRQGRRLATGNLENRKGVIGQFDFGVIAHTQVTARIKRIRRVHLSGAHSDACVQIVGDVSLLPVAVTSGVNLRLSVMAFISTALAEITYFSRLSKIEIEQQRMIAVDRSNDTERLKALHRNTSESRLGMRAGRSTPSIIVRLWTFTAFRPRIFRRTNTD